MNGTTTHQCVVVTSHVPFEKGLDVIDNVGAKGSGLEAGVT